MMLGDFFSTATPCCCTMSGITGMAVRLLASDGRELGRGLATLSSRELRELMGQAGVEVVHRDQLVITGS